MYLYSIPKYTVSAQYPKDRFCKAIQKPVALRKINNLYTLLDIECSESDEI